MEQNKEEVVLIGKNNKIDQIYEDIMEKGKSTVIIPLTNRNGCIGQSLKSVARSDKLELGTFKLVEEVIEFEDEPGKFRKATIYKLSAEIKKKPKK